MKKTGAVVLAAWGAVCAVDVQVQITNFTGNGTLTWNTDGNGEVMELESWRDE